MRSRPVKIFLAILTPILLPFWYRGDEHHRNVLEELLNRALNHSVALFELLTVVLKIFHLTVKLIQPCMFALSECALTIAPRR